MTTPSVGRIVHFVHDEIHYAAVIVHVWSEVTVNLYVLPNGVQRLQKDRLSAKHGMDDAAELVTSVSRADVNGNGEAPDHTWHWPEQV